jgi:hypothetical protein
LGTSNLPKARCQRQARPLRKSRPQHQMFSPKGGKRTSTILFRDTLHAKDQAKDEPKAVPDGGASEPQGPQPSLSKSLFRPMESAEAKPSANEVGSKDRAILMRIGSSVLRPNAVSTACEAPGPLL